MLNFIYSWCCYRNLKSGFLCDFYVKRFFLIFMLQLFSIFTWIFADKFLIEYCSLRISSFFFNTLTFFNYFFFFSYMRLLNFFLLCFFLFLLTFCICFY